MSRVGPAGGSRWSRSRRGDNNTAAADAARRWAAHDWTIRRIQDLPVFDDLVEVHVVRLEHLAWLDPHAQVTKRMAESVTRLH